MSNPFSQSNVPVFQGANVVGTQTQNSNGRLGLVATGTFYPTNGGTTNTNLAAQSPHIITEDQPQGISIVYGNYYGANESTNSPITVQGVSIEYPVGVYTPCKFNGNATSVILPNTEVATDFALPGLKAGTKIIVHTWLVNSAGGIMFAQLSTNATAEYGFEAYTGALTDPTTRQVAAASNLIYTPLAIVGVANKQSGFTIGDSRDFGSFDTFDGVFNYTGFFGRLLGNNLIAYGKLSVPGDTVANALTHFTNRRRLIHKIASFYTNEFGLNDYTNTNSATVVANRAALNALIGIPCYGVTIEPKTTSTDNWATLANQTIVADTRALNAALRTAYANGTLGESYLFDPIAILDPANVGKIPVSTVPGAATGTLAPTGDGIHQTPALYQLEVSVVAPQINQLKY